MAAESVSSAVCTHSKDSVHCQGRKIFLNYGRFVSCVLVQHPVWSYLLIENVVLEMEFWLSVAAERCKIWNFEMISKSKYLFLLKSTRTWKERYCSGLYISAQVRETPGSFLSEQNSNSLQQPSCYFQLSSVSAVLSWHLCKEDVMSYSYSWLVNAT